jgi:hypothetical protein
VSITLGGDGDDFWLSFRIDSEDAKPVPNVFNEVVYQAVIVLILVHPLILIRVISTEDNEVSFLVGEEVVHLMCCSVIKIRGIDGVCKVLFLNNKSTNRLRECESASVWRLKMRVHS